VCGECGDDEFACRGILGNVMVQAGCRAVGCTRGAREVDRSSALGAACRWGFRTSTTCVACCALDIDPVWFGAGGEGIAGPVGVGHVAVRGRLDAGFGWETLGR
jgi:hypothetical protein